MVERLVIEAFESSSCSGSPMANSRFVADFNPTDYTLARSNTYRSSHTKNTSRPKTDYEHGENDQLDIAFLFDGTGVNDPSADMPSSVLDRVDRFLSLLRYRGTIHSPPFCRVQWGGFIFKGVLKSANAQFVLFDKSGAPLRAKISAKFEEVVSQELRIAEEMKSSPDVDRVWLVQSGDRIDRIAHASYGNAGYWRQIASANRLSNPRHLAPGTVLSLPRLEKS